MNFEKTFNMIDALESLRPGEFWSLNGENYSGLTWISDTTPPTEKELFDEIKRLQYVYDSLEYQRLRKSEYPDFFEYLDGIVKNDQNQIDSYISACQAVKEKYPKPE